MSIDGKMLELNSQQFELIRPMLAGHENKAVYALSVLERNQKGRVFVNDRSDPTAAFITSCGGFYCLLGDANDRSFADDVVSFLNERGNPIGFYALAMFSEEWEDVLGSYRLEHANKIMRSYYRFNEEAFQSRYGEVEKPRISSEYRYETLRAAVANQYRNNFYTYYQIVWASNEHFMERGLGHFILEGGQIVSVCTSPYTGGGYAEIDIITIEAFMRRGLATEVGVQFIRECLDRGIVPNWCCHADNEASSRLADKLCFEHRADHAMYWYNA
jgi:RimJ/RimL family protein N-acetyltransferase